MSCIVWPFKSRAYKSYRSYSYPCEGGSQSRAPTAASAATTIQVHQVARMVEGLLLQQQQPSRQRTASVTSRSVIGITNGGRSNEVRD